MAFSYKNSAALSAMLIFFNSYLTNTSYCSAPPLLAFFAIRACISDNFTLKNAL